MNEKSRFAAYRERNKHKARFPGIMLNDYESALLERMSEKFGSKKAALIAGLEKLRDEES